MKILSLILTLLLLASNQIGKPYRYATAGPNSYDCSGLAVYCYQEVFDITLPRSAKDIGYCDDYETIKEIADLKMGDILCFNTNKSDSDISDHIGIYLGDGTFIHASSAKGKVLVSPLTEGYYHDRLSWGKRIVDWDSD